MLDDCTKLLFASQGSAELPLLFAPEVLRCTAAGPGGRPLRVLIDTGTDPSAIDLALARRLGLRLGPFGLGSDAASDAVPYTETTLPWLRMGGLEIRDLYVLAVDLSRAPFPVDLVLGYNVLCRLVLQIDYRRRRLRLTHPDLEPDAPQPGGATVPLAFYEHFPAIAGAQLANGLSLPPLTIDTGSNGGLTLSSDLALRAGLQPGAEGVAAGRGRGFVGECTVLRSAGRLQFGPFELTNVELDAPAGSGGDFGRAGRANIGNRLLARFGRVALDYGRGRCTLEPPVS
ncbi:MAG: hypothetical protein HC822_26405 [Oscillochloris sp.]|nr:hypothetical protein [Oscillochloris sp.]